MVEVDAVFIPEKNIVEHEVAVIFTEQPGTEPGFAAVGDIESGDMDAGIIQHHYIVLLCSINDGNTAPVPCEVYFVF